MKIGYLCSEFPALSHTFISREINVLEQEGFTIESASINPSRNLEKMGAEDVNRSKLTFYLKRTSVVTLTLTCLRYLLGLPRFLRALQFALNLCWKNGPRSLTKTLGYFVQAILLHNWARSKDLSHVHVHFANPAATVALVACQFGRLEYSLSVHGPDEFYETERLNLKQKVEGAVFVRCISFFCQSQLMRLTSTDQWGKFSIVRCGLYPREFTPRAPRTGRIRNLLCVGRLCPSKGQAILVQAAALLQARGIDFNVRFLGGGEDLDTLKRSVAAQGLQDRVFLEGPVGHDRVKTALEETDLFVLTSFAEGIPIALMEAMASGVPVVTTNITGIPELIRSGVEGFLTPASDVVGLADLLDDLLCGKIDAGSVVGPAIQRVATEYDVVANTKQLAALFIAERRPHWKSP